jgi:hypothetical protein
MMMTSGSTARSHGTSSTAYAYPHAAARAAHFDALMGEVVTATAASSHECLGPELRVTSQVYDVLGVSTQPPSARVCKCISLLEFVSQAFTSSKYI